MEGFVQHIRDFCEDSDDCCFENSYSGMFMYGRQCVGLVVRGSYVETLVMCQISNVTRFFNEIFSDNVTNMPMECHWNKDGAICGINS